MEEVNAFVRAAALGVPTPDARPEDLYDILPRQGRPIAGLATFATSGRRITLTAATSHFTETRRPRPTQSVSTTRQSGSPALTTSLPLPVATTLVSSLVPGLPTTAISSSPLGATIPTLSPLPSQPSPVQPSPIPSRVSSEQEQNGAQSSPAAPVTATPGGSDAGVIVGAILLVLVGIAVLAAVFFFIRKRVKAGGQPRTTTESLDFGPPTRTNPNLSRSEAAAMAELMRIAYRVENEGDGARGGGRGVSYYPGQPPSNMMGPDFPGGPGGGYAAAGAAVTSTPYGDEKRRTGNVARMQSLGSESVAQLGLRHPVGRWVHIQKPGAVASRTSGHYDVPDVPDMPAAPGVPKRYSLSSMYSGVAR